ncbi:MAG: LolA family protein [Solirubrobacteraceae bacterium]
MRYLRTASTGRLLAAIVGLVVAIGGGAAIAVAATSSNPVPAPRPLAQAVHSALSSKAPVGISADVQFTNNLISSSDFTGGPRDPLLQGASGRLWIGAHSLRIELQTSNGDAELVASNGSFWISDPASRSVYEGALPAHATGDSSAGAAGDHVPTVARIQAEIQKLMSHVALAGATTADPTDVGGLAAYSVSVSPKHSGGLLGSLQLAWDAARGVPLQFSIYARGNSTPVIQLTLTNVSYGAVPASDFAISPPSGYQVVKLATVDRHPGGPGMKRAMHLQVHGVKQVAAEVQFPLVAPASLVGLPRHDVTLLDWGGVPTALVTYGQGLGGIAVLENRGPGGSASRSSAGGSSGDRGGLSLPTVSIDGVTGHELGTALGTVLSFARDGVSYTVIGSVAPYAAEQAARALTP